MVRSMTPNNPFPTRPVSQLKLDDIIGYLSECQAKGWQVFRNDEENSLFPAELNERFILWLSEFVWIRIHYENGRCAVFVHRQADEIPVGYPETVQGLDELVAYGARSYGNIQWPSSPKTGRLTQSTPASNFTVLAGLIGSASVEVIFDPYLDDKALANLLILCNLGIRLSPTCRILTSAKGAKKLSSQYVFAWRSETSMDIEIRKSVTPNPHRRFMLLSGGQTLILGLSLNSLAKDEAAHLETNAADSAFFGSEWSLGVAV